ncbi:AlbA family DNA-binding domain-containing protein [Sorangium sp. So ce124]|uniref:AlbA family DNA-binding domain-containing protein n=1 Tax=Sorangium sp. So ce124 TaxID=3133280 RepID=UPI003F5D9AE2
MYSTYRRIATFSDVPPAGPLNLTAREHHRLDFKETASPTTVWEHAKDVASLSNTFGGVILIGARAKGGILEHKGIPSAFAADLKEAYEQAANNHCSPAVILDVIPIPIPALSGNLVFLAVNVEPTIEGPIGAKAERKDRNGVTIVDENAWVFPVREASQTKYLTPNELPMYMNPKVRRTLLLLDCIKDGSFVQLWVPPGPPTDEAILDSTIGQHVDEHVYGPLSLESINATKGAADLAKNSAIFGWQNTEGPYVRLITAGVPLTDIEDIWQAPDHKWNVRLGGRIIPPQNGSEPCVATYCPVVR